MDMLDFTQTFYIPRLHLFQLKLTSPALKGPCIWIVSIIFHFFHSDDHFHAKKYTTHFFMTHDKWTFEVECLQKICIQIRSRPHTHTPCPVLSYFPATVISTDSICSSAAERDLPLRFIPSPSYKSHLDWMIASN